MNTWYIQVGSSNGRNGDFFGKNVPAQPRRCLFSWGNLGKYWDGNEYTIPIFHVYYGHVIVRNSPGTFRPIRTLDDLSDSIHLKINAFIHHSITIWKCAKENHVFVLLPLVHLFNRVLVRFHWIIRFNIALGKRFLCMMHMCLTKTSCVFKKVLGWKVKDTLYTGVHVHVRECS